jgi:tRNA-dihydrouridine synthase A
MPVGLSAARVAGDDAEYALVSRFEFAQKRFQRQEIRSVFLVPIRFSSLCRPFALHLVVRATCALRTRNRQTRLPISTKLVLEERVPGSNADVELLGRPYNLLDAPASQNSNEMNHFSRKFSIAPMMEWTDRHCRFFHRLLTRRTLIYTEMITTGAVLYGDRSRLLAFDPAEHPVALQLGGSDPCELARCARIAEDLGYDEVNLNVGCPSDRVQQGRFGACLMAEPKLVGDCIAAMKTAVAIPVTVKCRIGIDEQDPEPALEALTRHVERAGVDALIVHARKAWLAGLSPRENRELPPLDYDRVHRLKAARPDLPIVLNGGITTIAQAATHLARVDGVMMGRAAYQEPWLLAAVDPLLFGAPAPFDTPKAAAEALIPYVERELQRGTRLNAITRHVLGLFRGVPGARAFRRQLATKAVEPVAGVATLRAALAVVPDMNAPTTYTANAA